MTSVSREIPSQFHYLVYSSAEEGDLEEGERLPLKIVRYANEFQQPKMPKSLCIFLKTLHGSTQCEYSIRHHNPANYAETEKFVQKLREINHSHIFLYLKSFVGA